MAQLVAQFWRDICYNICMAYLPKYIITDELLSVIAEIETLRSRIDTSYILPEREIEMRHRATVEATHSSTAIEGNPLNIKQVEKVLANETVLTRDQYAKVEVQNYKKALDWIDKRKLSHKPIVLKDVLTIHGIIMDNLLPVDKTGALRNVDVAIVNQDGHELYLGPKSGILATEITQLLEWLKLNENTHPVIVSAILHFQFVSIHPFSDGNGRTTRALTQLYLGLRNYDLRGALVLDSYYLAEKQEYYDALNETQGRTYSSAVKTNLNPWINYFVNGFLSSVKVLATEVAVLSSVIGTKQDQRKINQEDAEILSYARQFSSISLAEAKDVLPNVSRRTLQRKLKNFVDDGYLTVSGNGPSTIYRWCGHE